MILKWLSKFWPVLILIILTGIVAWKNVVPGTYLTGWDNLHPEFDFKTNIIDRGFHGVWQYYQGLGVPSGNAHVADLPRQIVLWIASWVVPQNLIRYAYHLAAWLGGGIGLYYLMLKFLAGEIGIRKKQVVALVGSIFYLFNLGTLQNFYAPYEAFSHFYLMLPSLLLVLLDYLRVGIRKKLFWLMLVNLIAVPMAYIPTIFIVYMGVCGLVLLSELFVNRLKNWKSVIISGLMILTVNSFWLLPFVHFVMFNTKGVVEAKINRMFTQEAFLRNEEYGELKHSLVMEGFWFDTTDMTRVEGQHDFMMRPWMDHIAKPEIAAMMWVLVAVVAIGYLYGLITRKKYLMLFLTITLLGLFALVNTNWPTGEVFKYLQHKLPLFAQVLRFPYTKFIFLVVIGYSVGVAWFAEMAVKHLRGLGYGLVGIIVVGIFWVQKPVFEGHFFYDNLRIKIPNEYFELYKIFQNEDRLRGRIANLPQPTFWGWTTYGWGYRGSGFPWYGIPQPMLDRNFDVWSPESEQYYAEIRNAIYDNDNKDDNKDYFLNVLDKYGVDYVWIDGWVINPQKPQLLDMTQVEEWLGGGGYKLVFSEGRQLVYKREIPVVQEGMKGEKENSFKGYPVVKLERKIMNKHDFLRYRDEVYQLDDLPKFIADRNSGSGLYGYDSSKIKFVGLKTPSLSTSYNLSQEFPDLEYDELSWWLREIYVAYNSGPGGKLKICLSKSGGECYYIGVSDNPMGGYRWGRFELKDTTSPRELNFVITGDVEMKEVRFGYFNEVSEELNLKSFEEQENNSVEFSLSGNKTTAKNCYLFGEGEFDRDVMSENDRDLVRYSAHDASSCETMSVGNSEILAQGGEISIETRNISGRPVKICLRHDLPGDCIVEEIVGENVGDWTNNIYQLPIVTKPGGLYLEIDNYAVGKEKRINDVGRVVITGAKKIVKNDVSTSKYYTNNQAYREGWVGILISNHKFSKYQILRHVKVDGWANGWIVGEECTPISKCAPMYANGEQEPQIVVIFYWPQMLEYLGFGLLGLTILFLVFPKTKSK